MQNLPKPVFFFHVSRNKKGHPYIKKTTTLFWPITQSQLTRRDSQNRKTIIKYQANAKSKHYDMFCLEKGQNGRCQRLSVSGSVPEEVCGGTVNSTFKLLPPPDNSEKSKTSQPLTSNWWQMFVTPSTPLPALNTQRTAAESVSGQVTGCFPV